MTPVNVLLGIGADEMMTIVFIIIGLLTGLAQALNKGKEQQAGGEEEPAADLEPVAPDEELRPKKPPALEDEINEFLRRAAQGRAGEKRPVQAQPVIMAGQQKTAQPPRPVQPKASPKRPAPVPTVEIPVEAEVVTPAPRPVGGRIESTVAKDLDTSALRRHSEQLGKGTRQTSQKVEQQLHAKFDHQLGKLAHETKRPTRIRKRSSAALPTLPATVEEDFAAMFHNVSDVREVIILNEILTRPVDRWS